MSMLPILGALLVIAGVVFLAAQAIRRGRLSETRPRAGRADTTLEPQKPAAGFSLRTNWPGLAMIALGVVLLLAAAA
jgi:hypothetical protein